MDFLRRDVLGRGRQTPREDIESPESPSSPSTPQMEERRNVDRTSRFSLSRHSIPNLLRSRTNTGDASISSIPHRNPPIDEPSSIDSPKTPTNRYTLTLSNFTTSRLDLPHLRSPTDSFSVHSPVESHIQSPIASPLRNSTTLNSPLPLTNNDLVLSPRVGQSRLLASSHMANAGVSTPTTNDTSVAPPSPVVHPERRRTVRFEDIVPPHYSEINRTETSTQRRNGRRQREGERGAAESSESNSGRNEQTGPKRKFLFCFPWVKSQRVRNQILACFVSGLFLLLMLGVYLGLSLSHQISSSQFAILIILIILFTTIIFCHALIRLCLYIVRPPNEEEVVRSRMNHFLAPGGYAIPQRPIRVVLARDEEAAGIDSETVNTKPPAYGLWRESVRVDPNRIYWQRNEEVPSENSSGASRSPPTTSSNSAEGTQEPRSSSPRPPSYVSDDGVNYVVEARPRSVAPTADVPLPLHPSERRATTPTAS